MTTKYRDSEERLVAAVERAAAALEQIVRALHPYPDNSEYSLAGTLDGIQQAAEDIAGNLTTIAERMPEE